MIIKKFTSYRLPILCSIIVAASLTTLLIYEYIYFKRQAERMLELQEEYRTYLFAVKKVIEEYNLYKDGQEKKKELSSRPDSDFPQINRDSAYLRDSMMAFYREQNIDALTLEEIDKEWQEYDPAHALSTATRMRKAPVAQKRSQKSVPYHLKKRERRSQPTSPRREKITHYKKDISFIWPITQDKFWISSLFGPRKHPNGTWGFHQGIDLAALKGTPVKAVAAGIVVEATEKAGFGKTVLLSHTNKYKTRYAHLNSIHVKVGQKIEQGDLIGRVGDTGLVRSRGKDASHLHFEVYSFGKRVNPMYYLG